MYPTLLRIYKNTGDVGYLSNAVRMKLITEDQKRQIIREVEEKG